MPFAGLYANMLDGTQEVCAATFPVSWQQAGIFSSSAFLMLLGFKAYKLDLLTFWHCARDRDLQAHWLRCLVPQELKDALQARL